MIGFVVGLVLNRTREKDKAKNPPDGHGVILCPLQSPTSGACVRRRAWGRRRTVYVHVQY